MIAIIAIGMLSLANAMPPGEPPPAGFSVSQFWSDCVGAVALRMQDSANLHSSRDKKSAVVGALKKGQRVTVLGQVDVLIEPGLATVNDAFEHNALNLQPGTEVYVMQWTDINYYEAWYDGKQVEGGLPIDYPGAFIVKKMPVVEHWVKVKASNISNRTAWALHSEAFNDWDAMSGCKRANKQ